MYRGIIMNTPKSEYEQILRQLLPSIPKFISGKDAILEMKNEGSPNWRQMEWIGFWFEHIVSKSLTHASPTLKNQKYGNTKFDLVQNYTWDLKVHPNQSKSLILNDLKAIKECMQYGGLGFIILSGDVDYDQNSKFKEWHDVLKGGVSEYETQRIQRKAPSRRRKVSFTPTSVDCYWFNNMSEIENCLASGILGYFQVGMRNSNGVPRLPKVMIKKISGLENYRIAEKILLKNNSKS
jgi:hypothetical protein